MGQLRRCGRRLSMTPLLPLERKFPFNSLLLQTFNILRIRIFTLNILNQHGVSWHKLGRNLWVYSCLNNNNQTLMFPKLSEKLLRIHQNNLETSYAVHVKQSFFNFSITTKSTTVWSVSVQKECSLIILIMSIQKP